MKTAAVATDSQSLRVRSALPRLVRFSGSHLLLLNASLCGLVWFLYGGFGLRGYGEEYLARTADFWLEGGWPSVPGLENVLLPGLAAMFAQLWTGAGFEFSRTTFILFAAAPYAIAIYVLAAHLRRTAGPVVAVSAALALYTSGMIPYMTSWGGSVDGLGYLSLVPVFVWPGSLAVFAGSAVLQGLNHYVGLFALVLFAFVWHGLKALDHERPRDGLKYWLAAFGPRAILAAAVLLGLMWYWDTNYPEASRVRQAIILEKWREPATVLQEVVGPFPWTLLSTLKLALVPIVALMAAPLPRRPLRALILVVPIVAAASITFVFVDVTRMALFMVIPAWLATVGAAGGDLAVPPAQRRRLRRVLLATAALNLLIPNYYVNNGEILVPPSTAIQTLISRYAG